ncbi:proto-oncogene tyrosine-protein kinase ROS isoform X2 [Ascaphus truei]|uniref:proto-oncogene tyrosine-protein kinase ROS isoform X2 n=1 Tax=Ascaphus truei TaxID=8439 RepID=UPI003F5A5937
MFFHLKSMLIMDCIQLGTDVRSNLLLFSCFWAVALQILCLGDSQSVCTNTLSRDVDTTNSCVLNKHTKGDISCEFQCICAEDASRDDIQDCCLETTSPYASSIGAYNVTLGWKAANISGATYIIQWKYVNISGDWKYTQTVTEPVYTVTYLQPYTEYLFRVIWIICQVQFYSPSSPVYRTHAFGVPAVAPLIQTLESSSTDTIDISWLPPPFPNGPIVGYNLKLSSENENQKHYSVTGRQSFQFYSTKPQTTYRVSITAVNEQGEGPAAEANITTLGFTVPEKSPWLFLSNNNTLKKRDNLKNDVHESQCLSVEDTITGLSINIYTQEIYFSEQNRIWVKGAIDVTDTSDLRIVYNGQGTITDISVDWLFNKIYFIMNEQVYNCDSNNCTEARDITLHSAISPRKIVADPYNGYLFILLDDGIHRINLPEIPVQDSLINHIVNSSTIQDFMMNVQSKRLVYVNNIDQGVFAIASVFLDGSDTQYLRQIQDGELVEIKSFLYINDSLFFTDGKSVFYELFQMGKYWYNEYLLPCNFAAPPSSDYNNLLFYGESTQPFPLPSQPRQVQVLFGTEFATVQWKPPETTLETSASAWQNWTYTVNISAQHPEITQVFSNITDTVITVTKLNVSTEYEVTVQASSPAGTSQWTVPIAGTSLHPVVEDPYFLAAGVDGLWRQPLDKFGPGKFLSDKLRLISDLDWYNGTLYWSNITGEVHRWETRDTAGLSASHIPGIRRAGALAFDWLGQFIYWSDKANSKIYRKPLGSLEIDTVTAVKYLAKDLAVDSINAFLYWSTDYTVESSRLNGQSHLTLQSLKLFSSTQVVALTVDLKYGLLYWLVKDELNINMYSAALRRDGSTDVRVTEFASWSSSEISQHALMFHSDRLFWINGQKYITVQEVNQRTCNPFSQPAEFTAFTLALKSLKPLPGIFLFNPNVIPDLVPSPSFEIRGNYSSFLILWKEPLNVEYGTVFYCVESKLLHQLSGTDDDLCLTPEDFTDPFYIVEGLEPYAEFDFAVTPYTYWGRGHKTLLTLRSPEGVPSPPLNPRIFLLRNSSAFDKENIGVELRWDSPKMSNGALIKFTISYRVINESLFNETLSMWTTLDTTVPARSFQLYDLSPGLVLQFQVKASTSAGSGQFSDTAEANILDIRPAPAIISVSLRLMTFIDTDRKEEMWNFSAEENINVFCYTAYDETVYYTLNDLLYCRDLIKHFTVQLLRDERLSHANSLTTDWIARHLYVTVKSPQNGTQLFVIDLEKKEKALKIINTLQISVNSCIEASSVYSLLSHLYWIESWDMGNAISYYDIVNDTVNHVLGHKSKAHAIQTSSCNCFVKHSELGAAMTLDTTDNRNSYIYFLNNGSDVWASDLEGCQCWKVITIPLLSGTIVTSLAVDDFFIYWSTTDKENATVYQASKYSNIPTVLEKKEGHIRVIAYSASLQPFPDQRCLMLAPSGFQPKIQSTTNTSFTVELPPVRTQATCPFIVSTTPTYTVTYRKLMTRDTAVRNCSLGGSTCTIIEYQERIALIPGLQPYSTYEIEVTVTNYYSFLLPQQHVGTVITGKTAYGVPEAVDTILVTVLSDSLVNVSWREPSKPNGPFESIRYQVIVNFLPPVPISPWRKGEFPEENLAWSLAGLHGGTNYHFKVLAFHPDENWFSESAPVHVMTFKAPAVPDILVPGNTSLALGWRAPEEALTHFWFELRELGRSDWFLPMNTSCTHGSIYTCILTGVVSNTHYQVQAVVIFMTEAKSVSAPASFKTTAGVPGKPGVPLSLSEDRNTIRWDIAEDNGSNLTYNILEYRKLPVNGSRGLRPWQVVYNDSCINICIWKPKGMEGTFHFRAAAANKLGLGDYSEISESIPLIKERTNFAKEAGIIVSTILAILLVVLLITAFVCYRKPKNKHNENEENTVVTHEDKELAELRGLDNAVGLSNACYAVSTLPTQAEMENLPSFPREKLTLCLFLGSGAFGEVYEGTAVDILGPETGTSRVAVKTLKKDATDHEKAEFLKEAHLMSQFDHSHILTLLGVCLFNEPQYIVLELMDGGDLLSYVRGARANTLLQNPSLSTLDLLEISENVSKGCAYLERMHFVHRDLAARNCLVSVKEYDNPARTVKIGDFGLARDVYKYDYYRKRGEGLLPVRWMAPESLIDGIFTSRADVWSFGVLLWEIFTLGQQPYPGYSNMEVLHQVRSGRRMESPTNCPDDLWDMMLKCWTQDPLKRPTFSYLQRQLEQLKGYSLRCTRTKEKIMDLEGVVNPAFEDTDGSDMSAAAEDTRSFTLTETRNAEGLNYLVVSTGISTN